MDTPSRKWYIVTYQTEFGPDAAPPETSRKWGYDAEHALERFYDAWHDAELGDGPEVLSVERQRDHRGRVVPYEKP